MKSLISLAPHVSIYHDFCQRALMDGMQYSILPFLSVTRVDRFFILHIQNGRHSQSHGEGLICKTEG